MEIRQRLEMLHASLQQRSFDGVLINVVLLSGDPSLVTFPTAEELDPHEHRIQYLRQEWVSDACKELEAILAIIKPDVSFPKFILANGRDFYFDVGESKSGLPHVTWATTKWTKDILTHAVDELLQVAGNPITPAPQETALLELDRTQLVDSDNDGPCDPNEWIINGVSIESRLPPTAFKLAKCVWNSSGKWASFDQIQEIVFEGEYMAARNIYDHQKQVNNFLKAHGIRLRMTTCERSRYSRIINNS